MFDRPHINLYNNIIYISLIHSKLPCTLYLICLLLLAVIGALIGKQKGRNIEIMNSFELNFSTIAGDVIIDRDYYSTKEEQCKLLPSICACFF